MSLAYVYYMYMYTCIFVTSPQAVRLLHKCEINMYICRVYFRFSLKRGQTYTCTCSSKFQGKGANTNINPRGEGGEGDKSTPWPPEINPIMHIHVYMYVPIEAWILCLYNTYNECMKTNLLLVHNVHVQCNTIRVCLARKDKHSEKNFNSVYTTWCCRWSGILIT